MIKSLHCTDEQSAVEEYMRSEHVILGEIEGIAKAQVNMSLRRKMKYGVNLERAEALEYIGRLCDVSMEETKI